MSCLLLVVAALLTPPPLWLPIALVACALRWARPDIVGSFVLGAIASLVAAAFLEYLRRPYLVMVPEHRDQGPYEGAPAREGRFVRVKVWNKARVPAWLAPKPAQQCWARITFKSVATGEVVVEGMVGRWASTPEPTVYRVPVGGAHAAIGFDMNALLHPERQTVTIPASKDPSPYAESLDIAAQLDEDVDTYAWNHENYRHEPLWRYGEHRLVPETYHIDIVIGFAEGKAHGEFLLTNSGHRRQLSLVPCMSGCERQSNDQNAAEVKL